MSKKIAYNSLFALSLALLIFTGKLAINSGAAPAAYTLQFMFLTAVFLSIHQAFTARAEFRRFNRRDLLFFLALGVIIAAAFLIGWIFGLKLTTTINYGLVTKSDIIFMPLLGWIILQEKITSRKIALMISFIVGLYLLMTSGLPVVPQLGDTLVLIGQLFFSLAAVFQKILVRRLPPMTVAWVRITFGFLFLLCVIPLFELALLEIRSPELVLAAALSNLFLAIFSNKALEVSSAAFYGMASMTVPIVVSILGVIFFQEMLNPVQLLGAVIILGSGFLASLWQV